MCRKLEPKWCFIYVYDVLCTDVINSKAADRNFWSQQDTFCDFSSICVAKITKTVPCIMQKNPSIIY